MNNYEIQMCQWEQRMQSLSPSELLKKIPSLKLEGDQLQLLHFGRLIALDLPTGRLRCLSDSNILSMDLKLNIYTFLWYCKEGATLSGEFLSFHGIKDVSPFGPAFQRTVLELLAATFEGKPELLKQAVLSLGGKQINEHSFVLQAFSTLPVGINFWDGDDEFPAQANILFDENSCDFIHPESLVTIAIEAMHRLAEQVDLPVVKLHYNIQKKEYTYDIP